MAFKDFFFFTKEERRGVVIILVVISALIGVRIVLAYGQEKGERKMEKEELIDSKAPTSYHRYVKKETGKLELNTVDTLQLQELKGIGPGYARRIVKYREKLGGYYAKEQLMEVYGFTEKLYNLIAGDIVVDATKIKKMNVNEMDISHLKRHPYLSFYEAKAIYDYRMSQPGGKIGTIDELSTLPDLKQNWQVIRIYITAE